MTSNLGHTEQRKKGIGFIEKEEETQHEINSEVKRLFRPELINRIDEQIVFNKLDEKDVKEILEEMLKELSEDLHEKYDTILKITDDAKEFIMQEGYSPEFGVRELRRGVERLIQIPLSSLILSGKIKEQRALNVIMRNEEIQIIPIDEEI